MRAKRKNRASPDPSSLLSVRDLFPEAAHFYHPDEISPSLVVQNERKTLSEAIWEARQLPSWSVQLNKSYEETNR